MRQRHSLCGGGGKAVCRPENDKITAALPCLRIALVTQKCISMLHGYGADGQLIRQKSFGGQLAVKGKHLVNDVIPDQLIDLQIYRPVFFLNHVVHLAILFSPFLTIVYHQFLLYTNDINNARRK